MSKPKQIEKLPDIETLHVSSGNEHLLLKLACETLWDKTDEIIDRYNEDAEAILNYITAVGEKGEEFYIRLMKLTELVKDGECNCETDRERER